MKKTFIAAVLAAVTGVAIAAGDGTDHVMDFSAPANSKRVSSGPVWGTDCAGDSTCFVEPMKTSGLTRAQVKAQLQGWTDPAPGDAS